MFGNPPVPPPSPVKGSTPTDNFTALRRAELQIDGLGLPAIAPMGREARLRCLCERAGRLRSKWPAGLPFAPARKTGLTVNAHYGT